MTKGELIDDIRERLQQYSDDTEVADLHISFLIDEARKMFIKQRYNKANKLVPSALFQQINLALDFENDNEFSDDVSDTILSTVIQIPTLIENQVLDSKIRIDNGSYTDIKFILIELDRFPYVGHNRLFPDVVYVAIGYDYKFKLKGLANRYKLLDNIRLLAVFEDPELAWTLSPSYNPDINYLDVEYPVDSDMGVLIADLIIKQLIEKLRLPIDTNNNATES
jgi:hypothetical protein